MKKELFFYDGSNLKIAHLERPQLLINTDGFPKVLYSVCSIKGVGGKKAVRFSMSK